MSAITRARSFAALSLLFVAVLVGSMVSLTPSADAATRGQRIQNALDIVRNQKGDPYQYGAAGPNRFDCSGLIYYSYRKAGFTNVPRTSSQQARFAHRISKNHMQPGDLMFFYDGGGVYHVAVFTGWDHGQARMVHAPHSGSRVHTADAWTSRWFAGTLR